VRYKAPEQTSAAGHDSFLDVVTNMVGILIVLVMVVGMRIKNAPVAPVSSPEAQAAVGVLEKDQATERSLHQDVAETSARIDSIAAEAAARRRQRDALATMAAALEYKIREARARLDAGAREDFDLQRELAEAEAALRQIEQQRARAEAARDQPEVVQSYATPLGKTVLEDEAHFHLRGGRIAHVPLEKLVLLARDDARRKADKLIERDDLPELTETVGPENGFRLRYTFERHDTVEKTPGGPIRYRGLKISQWAVIPVAGQLGETADEALASGSQFRRVLAELQPGKSTVTIWTYPDSFATFRRLRDELHRLGLRVAARPLPEGVMIAGSPKGSKSESE